MGISKNFFFNLIVEGAKQIKWLKRRKKKSIFSYNFLDFISVAGDTLKAGKWITPSAFKSWKTKNKRNN